ncbi:MAG: hypothetical protein K2N47_01575, partial [Clostridia bacterium]|nr:hypothetical protein [Clostridia bacterium]
MKPSATIAERQNDEEALTLIKASYHCLRSEQLLKYFMIVLSIAICIIAIFNRYLDVLLSGVQGLTTERIAYIQEQISIYLNLASGVIIVINLIFGFTASRMHTEGTVLRDRYDAYVFGNPPNLAILRPIPATYVSVYAKKVHKKEENFKNYIYGDTPVGNEAYAQFEYIKREAHSDYKLY